MSKPAPTPPPLNKQSIFLAVWSATTAASITLYGKDMLNSLEHAGTVCTLNGTWQTLVAILQPPHWLGLISLGLTITGLALLIKAAASKWPVVSDNTWTALIIFLAVIASLFAYGCR